MRKSIPVKKRRKRVTIFTSQNRKLTEFRRKFGLSQRDFSLLVGYTYMAGHRRISDIENGRATSYRTDRIIRMYNEIPAKVVKELCDNLKFNRKALKEEHVHRSRKYHQNKKSQETTEEI